jgi:peptidoglycan/LPS O-acetylase OafA/YrhL
LSTPGSQAPSSGRNVWLDVIRTAAIGTVILHHMIDVRGTPYAMRVVGSRGAMGVDLFFVLSGWLIGGQLFRSMQREGRIGLGRFWFRRWIRTLPVYYATMVVLLAVGHLSTEPLGSFLLFLQNYRAPAAWPVTWSLCIEEHFYLFLPLVLLAVHRRPRLTYAVIAGAALLSPTLRWIAYARYSDAGTFFGEVGVRTHNKLDGLATGVFLAYAHTRKDALWRWLEGHARALAVAGVALVLAFSYNPLLGPWTTEAALGFGLAVPGYLMVSVGIGLTLPACATLPAGRGARLFGPVVTWIAEHAYTLYLTHLTALWTMTQLDEWIIRRGHFMSYPERFALSLSLCAAYAVAMRNLVEKPSLRWRERLEAQWAARRQRAAAVAPGP